VGWHRMVGEVLGRAEGRLSGELRHLAALSPQRTLDRGYAVVTDAQGAVVRRASQVHPGDRVQVRLAAGRLAAAVTDADVDGEVEQS